MSEIQITNEQKRQVYSILKTRLKIAIQQEFYLEALLLEYSIMEDRLSSALKHAGIRHTNSKGEELGFKNKLDKVGNAIRSKRYPIYKRFKPELIESVLAWKDMRNALVHRSCQRIYNSEEVRKCAIDGNELVRLVTNAARLVKNASKKQKIENVSVF